MRKSNFILVGLLVAVVGVGGCGPEQEGKGAAPAASTPAGQAGSAVKVDADGFPTPMCGLIGKELVGSTLGLAIVNQDEQKTSCEYQASSLAVGWYKYWLLPLDSGGQQNYDSSSKSAARNPDYQKVSGPWVEAFYYREFGGAIALVFKTSKFYVSTSIGGRQLTGGGANQNLSQMTTLASSLAKVLG